MRNASENGCWLKWYEGEWSRVKQRKQRFIVDENNDENNIEEDSDPDNVFEEAEEGGSLSLQWITQKANS